MAKNRKIEVDGRSITVVANDAQDYISLTDIAKYKTDDSSAVIGNWMRNRNTLEFLGIWESLYNPDFKPLEFEGFKKQAGLNSFTLSPQKWVNTTNAMGIVVKSGRYGGTYAHKDIAFKFASWISVEFELHVVKVPRELRRPTTVRRRRIRRIGKADTFQRLKEAEHKQLGWSVKRELTKINYRIHTDAIRANLIPPELTGLQISLIYASEADVLNMALFGMTAKDWREANPGEKGNIRDQANASQLVCLANLENLNALFINEGMAQPERLQKLNRIAIEQMEILTSEHSRRLLGGGDAG